MVPEFHTVVGKIHLGPCVEINGPGFKEKPKYDNNLSQMPKRNSSEVESSAFC